jgi:hypothetical protein
MITDFLSIAQLRAGKKSVASVAIAFELCHFAVVLADRYAEWTFCRVNGNPGGDHEYQGQSAD